MSRQNTEAGAEAGAELRCLATQVIVQVVAEGRSLATAMPMALTRCAERDRALLQELCYGTLRWHSLLHYLLNQLLNKPLKTREHELRALLLVGLYQLLYLRLPQYAALSSTVAAARQLQKSWATGLVNAVLRAAQRRGDELLQKVADNTALSTAHPAWLAEQIRRDWPHDWQTILQANNQYPPQTLRVNLSRISRVDYLQQLAAANITAKPLTYSNAAVAIAEPCDITRLPGFNAGLLSLQDEAAQLAAPLLAVQAGQRVLDACAAPGGKTCHLLETQPDMQLLAVERDAGRLQRLRDNLHRLGLQAELKQADAGQPDSWWDGQLFDRILLDAPCSGTGVIRRHPDIKLLRRADDIERLAELQQQLLQALWPLLRPRGLMLYVTCSVLKQENTAVLANFLQFAADATVPTIPADWGRADDYGRQILPGTSDQDGFYYACLQKQ